MWIAQINKKSPRYRLWLEAFGADQVAVLEPPKESAAGQMRVLVDVTRLTREQQRSFASMLSRQLQLPIDRVLNELLASGSYAISGEHVEVRPEPEQMRLG